MGPSVLANGMVAIILWYSEVKSLSRIQLFAAPWTVAYQASLSMDFPGKNTGVGYYCLLRRLCCSLLKFM